MILLLDWETIIYHDLLAQLGEHYLCFHIVIGSLAMLFNLNTLNVYGYWFDELNQ